MINPPSSYMAPTSVGQMMGGAVANSSDMAAMMAYTDKMTNGSDKAANWGMNIDMAQIDPQYHQVFLENVMYTRAFLGANPEVLKDDGSIDLNSRGAPMQLPTDMANVNNAVDAQPNAQTNAQTNGVSGAAATVGSAVGQIARLKGASRVIGSAGGPEKNRIVTERYGFDACLDYKRGDVMGQLGEAAPDGIDVYFDNVGGEHLEAAIQHFNDDGRAALCGAISQYNDDQPAPGPRNMGMMVTKRLMLQGFIQSFHTEAMGDFLAEMGPWLAAGEIVADETVEDGIDQAFDAFLGMMQGRNVGKMVVRTAVAD